MFKSKQLIQRNISAIFVMALLFSCSNLKVEKRLHQKGFYLQVNNNVVKSESKADDNNLTTITTKKIKKQHFEKQEVVSNKLVDEKSFNLQKPTNISRTKTKGFPSNLQEQNVQFNKKKSFLNGFNFKEHQVQKGETKNPDGIINIFALISFILFLLFLLFVVLLLVYNITAVGLLLGILSLPLSISIGLAIIQFYEHPDKYKFQWMAKVPYYTFLVLVGLAIISIIIVFIAVILYLFV